VHSYPLSTSDAVAPLFIATSSIAMSAMKAITAIIRTAAAAAAAAAIKTVQVCMAFELTFQ
jgi:hypothetical protein